MSEQSLDQLIATLKAEAIDSADRAAREILDNAREEARIIKQKALKEKELILAEAKRQAEKLLQTGKKALAQSARDVTLQLQNDFQQLFEVVLNEKVREEFDEDLIRQATLLIFNHFGKEAEITLPEGMAQKITEMLKRDIPTQEPLGTIIGEKGLINQFMVRHTAQGWIYEITPSEIASILSKMLGSEWATILKNSVDHA